MKRSSTCPKCGGAEIIADAKVLDRNYQPYEDELTVAADRKPDALLFKGRRKSTLSAWICADSGFTEFYADEPGNLRN